VLNAEEIPTFFMRGTCCYVMWRMQHAVQSKNTNSTIKFFASPCSLHYTVHTEFNVYRYQLKTENARCTKTNLCCKVQCC